MKKLLTYTIMTLLALSLCSCLAGVEPEPVEPQSVPELESIVDPVLEDESSAEADFETESRPAYPGKMETSVFIVDQKESEPVISNYVPPASSEAEANTTAKAEEPEPLKALAADMRLDSEAIEKELFRLINSLREEEGVSALGIEDNMRLAARIRAAEAFESFSHTRPDGTPYNTAFDKTGFSYTGKWHGENLSSLSCPSGSLTEEEIAFKMFNGLKNSPGHYRNMTEKNFAQTGIGVAVIYTEGNIDITSAQMFSGL